MLYVSCIVVFLFGDRIYFRSISTWASVLGADDWTRNLVTSFLLCEVSVTEFKICVSFASSSNCTWPLVPQKSWLLMSFQYELLSSWIIIVGKEITTPYFMKTLLYWPYVIMSRTRLSVSLYSSCLKLKRNSNPQRLSFWTNTQWFIQNDLTISRCCHLTLLYCSFYSTFSNFVQTSHLTPRSFCFLASLAEYVITHTTQKDDFRKASLVWGSDTPL